MTFKVARKYLAINFQREIHFQRRNLILVSLEHFCETLFSFQEKKREIFMLSMYQLQWIQLQYKLH